MHTRMFPVATSAGDTERQDDNAQYGQERITDESKRPLSARDDSQTARLTYIRLSIRCGLLSSTKTEEYTLFGIHSQRR